MVDAERVTWAARLMAIEGPSGHARDVAVFEAVHDAILDPSTLIPVSYPAQPGGVYELAEVARTRDHERLASLLSTEERRKEMGRYRVALTDVEQTNTMRLQKLAWLHEQCKRLATAYPEQATGYEQMAQRLEAVAAFNWRTETLSTAQGWAARKCFRMALLPAVLREWTGS